jgi:hypothetical protein
MRCVADECAWAPAWNSARACCEAGTGARRIYKDIRAAQHTSSPIRSNVTGNGSKAADARQFTHMYRTVPYIIMQHTLHTASQLF